MIRAVVVDDEELSRRVLREYLTAHRDVEIVAECANGFEAVKAITELKPDLVFLDIQMPKLDGFEVLELLEQPVSVVFVTAFDQYAIRAFEVHAVDYLLKPFSAERLAQALAEARVRKDPLDVAGLVADARPGTGSIERILIRDGSQVHVIPVDRVDYIEAQDDYACIRSEGKSYLKEQPLGELAAALDPTQFVRIHRSYILNLERLARIELYAKDSRVAILRDGTKLPVSRAGYVKLSDRL
jgi:two-component system, LytTR family, response regulator